jgi:hypothetical protein
MDFNIFGSTPEYYTGLLGQEATDKLRKRATGTGVANALLALVAQPRNQGYGSALPYIGRALMAGQQAGQNVIEGGLRDFDVQQRLADIKRRQEQQQAQEQYINTLPQEQQNILRAVPSALPKLAENQLTPPQRETFVAPDGSIRFRDTGEVARQENVLAPQGFKTIEVQEGRNKVTYQVNPDGTRVKIASGSMDAPQMAAVKPLYAQTPVETASGYVYMPTPEGMAQGRTPIEASTGRPVQNLMGNKQMQQQQLQEKQRKSLQGTLKVVNNAQNAINKAAELITESPRLTTGVGGFIASNIPATKRKTLEGAIKTIQANLSFQALNDMRAASPTGGALGNVTERELDLLGSTVANLSPDLPPEELLSNLNFVNAEYRRLKALAENDLRSSNMNMQAPSDVPPEVWNAMTPEEKSLWQN